MIMEVWNVSNPESKFSWLSGVSWIASHSLSPSVCDLTALWLSGKNLLGFPSLADHVFYSCERSEAAHGARSGFPHFLELPTRSSHHSFGLWIPFFLWLWNLPETIFILEHVWTNQIHVPEPRLLIFGVNRADLVTTQCFTQWHHRQRNVR